MPSRSTHRRGGRHVRYALAIMGAVVLPLAAAPGAAPAGEKIALGHTASDSYVAAMVAKDKGLFEKRGLDIDLQIIALNSAMPAALHAGAVQIAGRWARPASAPIPMCCSATGCLPRACITAGSISSKFPFPGCRTPSRAERSMPCSPAIRCCTKSSMGEPDRWSPPSWTCCAQIPIVVYSATREWAAKHRSAMAAFREAII